MRSECRIFLIQNGLLTNAAGWVISFTWMLLSPETQEDCSALVEWQTAKTGETGEYSAISRDQLCRRVA
jgi:hypothetical protein